MINKIFKHVGKSGKIIRYSDYQPGCSLMQNCTILSLRIFIPIIGVELPNANVLQAYLETELAWREQATTIEQSNLFWLCRIKRTKIIFIYYVVILFLFQSGHFSWIKSIRDHDDPFSPLSKVSIMEISIGKLVLQISEAMIMITMQIIEHCEGIIVSCCVRICVWGNKLNYQKYVS